MSVEVEVNEFVKNRMADDFPTHLIPQLQTNPLNSGLSRSTSIEPRFLTLTVGGFDIKTEKDDKKDFFEELDCTRFTRDDIIVKVVGRNIIVQEKQEETQDEDNSKPKIIKKYLIEDQYNLDEAKVFFISNNALAVYVPRQM